MRGGGGGGESRLTSCGWPTGSSRRGIEGIQDGRRFLRAKLQRFGSKPRVTEVTFRRLPLAMPCLGSATTPTNVRRNLL